MIINYLKSALRFIRHNKVFAAINILSLSIALAASFIILLYVVNEISFDHCHKKRQDVYRVVTNYHLPQMKTATTSYFVASALKDEFPQILKASRVNSIPGLIIKTGEELFPVQSAKRADPDIFDIFSLSLSGGHNGMDLLDDPSSILLSRSLADKIFAGKDPVGDEIRGVITNSEYVFTVRGVYENIPENSSLQADCLLSCKLILPSDTTGMSRLPAGAKWYRSYGSTWVLLSHDCNPSALETQLKEFEKKNLGENPPIGFELQNLKDVHLRSDEIANSRSTGNLKNIKLFSGIAILILLVAAINYIILSTAVSTGRSREIGIRKTFGAANSNIKNQMLGESMLLALFVFPVSLILMRISLDRAGDLFQADLKIIPSNIAIYVSLYLVLTTIIGIISGLYTASYLSGLKVVDVLKSTITRTGRKQFFRSSLIVVQLLIFCSFVSATLIIRGQYEFALKMNPGYYNKDILLVNLPRGFNAYPAYINNIRANPNIIMASATMTGLPSDDLSIITLSHSQDPTRRIDIQGLAVHFDFLKTMGIEILEGREFSREYGSDLKQAVLLNETAVDQLGLTDPVGKKIGTGTIIGVVKDFNLHSVRSVIPPLKISMTERYISQVAVHYKPGTLNSILPMLRSEWEKVSPGTEFRYNTIEDITKKLYVSEKNLSTIIRIFALFTILIAASGLFGLTLFIARSRKREIGIRKIFGSSEKSIVFSFMLRNLVLVFVASLLSIPLVIYFMAKWLNNFAFKTEIYWWVFVISFVVATVVVMLTVFIHSYKVSRINPLNALRYE
jgi:putative ABC transport system permease protein